MLIWDNNKQLSVHVCDMFHAFKPWTAAQVVIYSFLHHQLSTAVNIGTQVLLVTLQSGLLPNLTLPNLYTSFHHSGNHLYCNCNCPVVHLASRTTDLLWFPFMSAKRHSKKSRKWSQQSRKWSCWRLTKLSRHSHYTIKLIYSIPPGFKMRIQFSLKPGKYSLCSWLNSIHYTTVLFCIQKLITFMEACVSMDVSEDEACLWPAYSHLSKYWHNRQTKWISLINCDQESHHENV